MRVKPRHVEEVIAIRLVDDLIAEHGNVLIIRGDETVEVISEDEFDRIFEVNTERDEDDAPRRPVLTSPVRPPAPPVRPTLTRMRLNSEERIILAFGPDTDGNYLHGLSVAKLAQILERMPTVTLLDRLAKLSKNKHIVGSIEDGTLVYSLTSLGKEISAGLRQKRMKH